MTRHRNNSIPFDPAVERAIIGAALRYGDGLNQVMAAIPDVQLFQDKKHRIIYETMLSLYQQGHPVDILTVQIAIGEQGKLKEIGYTYIGDLAEDAPATPLNFYFEKIREHARVQQLARVSRKFLDSAGRQDIDISELIHSTEQQVLALHQLNITSKWSTMSETIPDVLTEFDDYQTGKAKDKLVHTGITDLDWYLGGLHPGRLYIIAGDTSRGKTQLALQIGLHVSKNEHPVGLVSLEMPKKGIVTRQLCTEAKVDSEKVKHGTLTKNDWVDITRAQQRISKCPFYLLDPARMTVAELWSHARQANLHKKIELLIVDYLQLLDGGKHETREREVAFVSASTKAIAKELQIPVIVLSQLKRRSDVRAGKEPVLSDLRESGMIENDADAVIFVFLKDDNDANLIIAKNRDGRRGKIDMSFIQGRWEQKTRDHQTGK